MEVNEQVAVDHGLTKDEFKKINTDEELKKLDDWVRKNTIKRFGPVREVHKELVLEIAFDSINESKRHKSGIALRFPRIHRIRWDKPVKETDYLGDIKKLFNFQF